MAKTKTNRKWVIADTTVERLMFKEHHVWGKCKVLDVHRMKKRNSRLCVTTILYSPPARSLGGSDLIEIRLATFVDEFCVSSIVVDSILSKVKVSKQPKLTHRG